MCENEKLETEEIRFIYKLILDGWGDSDILNKCISLRDSGEINFPLWTDKRYIKNRRKEMEIASEVLKDSIKKIIKIYSPKLKNEHFAQIAEISAILLQNNLSTISVVENLGDAKYKFSNKYLHSYTYIIKDRNNIPNRLNRLQLIEILRRNVQDVCKRYGISFFYDCYVPHVKATMGEEMEAMGGFWPAVEIKPYEVIKAIKLIMDGKELKGSCPLCEVENQLPPFIKSIYNDVFQSRN
jgi:hypothetical protein